MTPKRRKRPKSEYTKYLSSKEWKDFKKRFRESGRNCLCEVCGSDRYINFHHKTYVRLYHEELDDVVCLCAYHHRNLHKWLRRKRISLANMDGWTDLFIAEARNDNHFGYIPRKPKTPRKKPRKPRPKPL